MLDISDTRMISSLFISISICSKFFFLFLIFIFIIKHFICFNWRLITLQYCGGFCHTSTWISHGCTCPLILNPSPTSLPTPSFCIVLEHQLWVPNISTELELVICFTYGNIYVSVLFSQIIPPLPSPTQSKSLFLHLCIFCYLTYRVIVTIFLNSIYMC